MNLRNGKIINRLLPISTGSKNRTPNINSPVFNQICTRTSNPGLRSTPSKFSKFNNCVKAGNASSARLFNKNARGYPKILPCNARK